MPLSLPAFQMPIPINQQQHQKQQDREKRTMRCVGFSKCRSYLTAVTTTRSLFVRLVVSLAVHLKPTTSIRHVTPHPPGTRKQRGMLSQSQYESLRDRHYFLSQRRRRVEDGAEMFVGDDTCENLARHYRLTRRL
jgi:hypothetical protein